MGKINTYTSKGNKGKATDFPKSWQEKENKQLLAQAIRVYEAKSHPGLSKVKTRGEVAHSTRKIYRQKGTGSARHGDRGAPIFVKGGIAHGPKGVKRRLSIPKKMAKKALAIALTLKAKDGYLVFVDDISKILKTKQAASLIDKISKKEKFDTKNLHFTFALSEENKAVRKVLRNLKNAEVVLFKNLNAHTVFSSGVLVVDRKVLDKGIKGRAKTGSKGRSSKGSA